MRTQQFRPSYRQVIDQTTFTGGIMHECLMHYANQPAHRLLDRQAIKDVLLRMSRSRAITAPGLAVARPDPQGHTS